jgi:kynureninase
MESIARAARRKGCAIGFDLAHAVGNIELRLHDWDVDFAVWCTYKYLNAGPGGIGGCFVHERYAAAADLPRFEGWWGNEPQSRFLREGHARFRPNRGAKAWQTSSPPLLSMAALRASLEVFAEAKMPRLIKKSAQLGDFLHALIQQKLAASCESLTPRNSKERGCQLTLKVKSDAKKLQSRLLERGIVCDSQGTSTLRVAPVPLYNSYADIDRLVTALQACLADSQPG